MQRYFVNQQLMSDQTVTIAGDDAHHMIKVMRMNPGNQVICCSQDGGQAAICEIAVLTDSSVQLKVIQTLAENHESPVQVTIAQGVPKADKLELVIQKGTELGAYAFLPFFASRSIVKWDEKKGRKKVERLEKIAKEAAEQSHRNRMPTVRSPIPFKQLIKESDCFDIKLVAFEEDAKIGERSRLKQVLNHATFGSSILVVFGPEGGLSTEEVLLLKQHQFISCGLGPRILRTETAPLYFLSAVSYQIELLE